MSYTGWSVLPLFFLLSTGCCMPDGDLCRWMNGRKYYIDVGESGIISAENVTNQAPPPPVIGLKGSLSGNETIGPHPQIPQRCSVELITCPSCHFRVTVLRMNIPPCSADGSCRCDFVWVKEAAYSKSGQEFCGQKKTNETASLNFESKTKLVSVDFLYTGAYLDAFALQFSAIKNVYVYKGGYNYYQPNSTGVITSPNFPGGYPSDYSAEYILQNVDTTGYVQLLFTDFQLSLWSYMEILDSNGSRIDVYNGNTFRPPALISSGPIMTVKFQANEEYPSSGFRAIYTFVSYAEKYWINRPSTDCGGFVEDYGGAITMMNMVPGNVMRAYDCIWLIRPQNAVIPGMQISVRVAQFEEMGSKSTLTIRKGLYSEASIVESITPYQQHKLHRGQEYVVHANIGFYIRLIGYFNNRSHLAIIYSTFRYEGCYAVGDFECENGRCIKNALRCDGFNHCGDGSDEASCYGANQGTPLPEDANWWRTLTPNYYFPKSDGGSNAGTNTLILVTSLAGLGMFVLTTIVILVKLHKQRQDDSISREILQTISADIEAENAQYTQAPPSDPPMYDPPPSYEDVIKYYLPPPPAYSSVNRIRTNNPRTGTAANDQAEISVNIRGRGRRARGPKHRNATLHEALEPVILRVSLPAEERNLVPTDTVASSSDARTSPSTSTTSSNAMVQSSRSTVKQSNSPNENLIQQVHSSLSAGDQNKATTRKTSPIKTIRKCSRLLRATTKAVNCDCHGACSCSLQKVYVQNENTDSQPKTSFVLQSHPYTNEGYSCHETTHTLNNKKSLSIPFISPSEVVTVTVRPSRSKSFVNDSTQVISKSAGPSSPSACHSDTLDSSNRLTHRRSSSGPSEVFCTFDQDSNSTSVTNSPTSDSLNKVNSNATTVSPGSSTDTAGSENKSDKNILPLGWGTLWNPVRRRSDRDETLKTKIETELWQQSDRQPLLTQRSPKTENLSHLQDHEKENQTSQTNKNIP